MSISSNFVLGLTVLVLCQAALAGNCGTNYTAQDGFINSPGFPLQYGNSLECDWYINPNVTSGFLIRSISFSTEECCDKVTVSVIRISGSEEKLQLISGKKLLSVAFYIDRGDIVHVNFHTDSSVVSSGFRLLYRAQDTCPESSDYFQCNDGFLCVRSSFTCDGVLDCIDGSDEWQPMCPDTCRNDTLYHCANGQCVLGRSCDLIVDCDDGSDESRDCTVAEEILVGDSLQATLSYQLDQKNISVAVCSHDTCEALNLLGLSPDHESLAYESYAQCNSIGRNCDDNSLVNWNYPDGWTALTAASWQFFVSIRAGFLSVSWKNATRDDAILPLSSVSGKRLVISPLDSVTWISPLTTEGPSSFTSPDVPYSTSASGEASDPTAIISSSTSTATPYTAATSAPPLVTTSMTSASVTFTPSPSTARTTTSTTTTSAPTSTSTTTSSPFTVTTTPRAVTTTTPVSTAGSTTITPAAPTYRPTVTSTGTAPTTTMTSTTPTQSPIWTTTERSPSPNSTTTLDPDVPTSPTPTPPSSWLPEPAPPVCPTDFPLRYQYLLIPVESHCQLYVICFAGWGQSMECPHPLTFSYEQQKCIWSWNSSCAVVANKT